MKNEHEFDALLQEALSEYRDAEPLAGIEDRVLLRFVEKRTQSRGLWLKWIAAAFCAIALAIVAWMATRSRTATPQLQPIQAASRPAPATGLGADAQQTLAFGKVARNRPAQHHADVASTAPSQPDQFPTGVRLTESEHAFLAASAKHAIVSPDQDVADQPLGIAEIAIKPLSETNPISGENQ